MKKLVGYFLRGSLILVPFSATLYILWLLFATVDQLLPAAFLGRAAEEAELGYRMLLRLGRVALVVVIAGAVVVLVGFLTSNVIGRTLFEWTERLFTRLPFVKVLYRSVRDLVGAFVGDRRRFDKPVAVSFFPDGTAKILGFVTRDGLPRLGMPGHVAVYFPQSYNFAGNLIIVPADRVERIDVASGDLMTFIVSGGVSGLGVDFSASAETAPSVVHPS